MSYSKQFYVGPFLKVLNPVKECLTNVPGICCPNQECVKSNTVLITKPNTIYENYCSSCGTKLITTTTKINSTTRVDVHNTCIKLFKEGDIFCGHIPVIDGCQVIIPNNRRFTYYTDDSYDEDSIISFSEFSEFDFDNEEWQILIDELLSQGFQLEKDIGIIHYVY